jgi:hypothetical protein
MASQAAGHRFRTKPQHCGEDLVKQENSNSKQKMLYNRKNSLLVTKETLLFNLKKLSNSL